MQLSLTVVVVQLSVLGCAFLIAMCLCIFPSRGLQAQVPPPYQCQTMDLPLTVHTTEISCTRVHVMPPLKSLRNVVSLAVGFIGIYSSLKCVIILCLDV